MTTSPALGAVHGGYVKSYVDLDTVPEPPLEDVLAVSPAPADEERPPASYDGRERRNAAITFIAGYALLQPCALFIYLLILR